MLALSLIERKRDGDRIRPAEWQALISAYVAGEIPDYQMALSLWRPISTAWTRTRLSH